MEARKTVVDNVTALSPASVTTSVQNLPHFPMCTHFKKTLKYAKPSTEIGEKKKHPKTHTKKNIINL